MKSELKILFLLSIVIGMIGCFTSKKFRTTSIPVITNFELNRYLGMWYEIARLPNSFEKNLDRVTATYSLRNDGKIEVLNKGFDLSKEIWKEAKGKAWISDEQTPARLKVSFFWIFASDYKIIALDTATYSYAMVTSGTKKYLWILSRTPQMDEATYSDLIQKAKSWDFQVDKLYRVKQ